MILKKIVLPFLAGVMLASGTAYAASQANWRHGGIKCQSTSDGIVACGRLSDTGYTVGINRTVAVIARASDGKIVAYRREP